MPIDLKEPQQDQADYSFGSSPTQGAPDYSMVPGPPPVPLDVATERARKYDYGLGEYSPGKSVLQQAIVAGTEAQHRTTAALDARVRAQTLATQYVSEYIKSRPMGEIKDSEIASIREQVQSGMTVPDPKVYFEKQYAEKLLTDSLKRDQEVPQNIVEKAAEEDAKATRQILDKGRNIIVGKEIAQKVFEELGEERKAAGWAPYLAEQVVNLATFGVKPWYAKHNVMLPKGASRAFLSGNNVEEQAFFYYNLHPEEMESRLRAAVAEVKKSGGLDDAYNFAGLIASNSSSDVLWENVQSILALGTGTPIPFIGIVPYGVYKAATLNLASAVKSTVAAAGKQQTNHALIMDAAGRTAESARIKAVEMLDQQALAAGSTRGLDTLKNQTRTIFAPEEVFQGTFNLSNERASRVLEELNNNAKRMVETGSRGVPINRLEPGTQAYEAAMNEAEKALFTKNPELVDHVLNVSPTRPDLAAEFTIQRGLRERIVKLQQQIRLAGKEQQYSQYEIARSNSVQVIKQLNEALAEVNDPWVTTAQRLFQQSVESPTFSRYKSLEEGLRRLTTRPTRTFNVPPEIMQAAVNTVRVLSSMNKADRELFGRLYVNQQAMSEGVTVGGTQSGIANLYGVASNLNLRKQLGETGRVVKGLGNIDYLAVQLGTKDAVLFSSEQAADNYAKDVLRLLNYRVKSQGQGHYIEVYQALPEATPTVRNSLKIDTQHNPTPNLMNAVFGWFRNRRYIIPETMNQDFQTATFGASYLANIEKEVINKGVGRFALRDESRKRLSEFVEAERVTKNKDGTRGVMSKTQGDLETKWVQQFNRMPTEQESLAYWTAMQINNWDLVLRSLNIMKRKSRLGFENFALETNGFKPKWGLFEGRVLANGIPKDIRENWMTLVWDKNPDNFKVIRHHTSEYVDRPQGAPGAQQRLTGHDFVDSYLADGYKLIQLSQFGAKDLKDYDLFFNYKLPKGDIHFVLVQDARATPLNFQQIPARAGIHHEAEANVYIRQPQVANVRGGGHVYYGDKNLHGFQNNVDANKWLKQYEAGRKMVREVLAGSRTDTELQAFLDKNLPMYTSGKFKALFDNTKGGIYDIDTPFIVTPKNVRTWSTGEFKTRYPEAVDNNQSKLNPFGADVDLQYALERGEPLTTIVREGDRSKPSFNIQPAKLLDAFPTLDRAMSNLIQGRYLDDVKLKYVDRFIAEFGHLLDRPQTVLQENPMRYIFNTPWKAGLVQNGEYWAARNYLRSLKQFLNLKPESEKAYDWVMTKVADSIYRTAGQKAFERVEPWTYHTKDPIQGFKSMAFDTKIGSLNPSQLLVQYQTFTHLMGVEGPIRTTKVMPAMAYSRYLWGFGADSEAYITQAAKNVSKLGGWKPEWFIESHNALRETGFMNVARETAMMDDFLNPGIVTSRIGTMREWGRIFFNEGERGPRIAAWHAAYDRWRSANPTATFDNEAIKQVLSRANISVGDMSAAASAGWQKGFGGIPGLTGQFATFQVRLFEQMISKGLTPQEKARVLLAHSFMYGIPVAAGIFAPLYPLASYLKQATLEKEQGKSIFAAKDMPGGLPAGIDIDDSAVLKFLHDGFQSIATEILTNGQKMNVGERFGPTGVDIMKQFFDKDKTAFQLVTGVAGTSMQDIVTSLYPVRMAIMSPFIPTQDQYPLTMKDFHNIMSNFTSYSNARKAYVAMTLGEYISKNQDTISKEDKINTVEALMMGLTGLQPQRIADYYKQIESLKDTKEHKAQEEKYIQRYYRDAILALDNGDQSLFEANMIKVKAHTIAGGFRQDEIPSIFNRANAGLETRIERIEQRFAKESPERLEAFLKKLRYREQQRLNQ